MSKHRKQKKLSFKAKKKVAKNPPGILLKGHSSDSNPIRRKHRDAAQQRKRAVGFALTDTEIVSSNLVNFCLIYVEKWRIGGVLDCRW